MGKKTRTECERNSNDLDCRASWNMSRGAQRRCRTFAGGAGAWFIMFLTVSEFNRKVRRRRENRQRDEMKRIGGDGRTVRETKWKELEETGERGKSRLYNGCAQRYCRPSAGGVRAWLIMFLTANAVQWTNCRTMQGSTSNHVLTANAVQWTNCQTIQGFTSNHVPKANAVQWKAYEAIRKACWIDNSSPSVVKELILWF